VLTPIKTSLLPVINEVSTFACTVYVVQESGTRNIKVGVAVHPARRLCSLQTGNPRPLHFAAVYEGPRSECLRVEKSCHRFFNAVGSEWFAADTAAVVRYLDSFTV